MQVLTVVYAVVVSISRVTDNKHHPTDVLAGAVLGLTIAALALCRLGQANKDYRYCSLLSDEIFLELFVKLLFLQKRLCEC